MSVKKCPYCDCEEVLAELPFCFGCSCEVKINLCPDCGKPLIKDAVICQECGFVINYCPSCQVVVNSAMEKCVKCGIILNFCPKCSHLLLPEMDRCEICS